MLNKAIERAIFAGKYSRTCYLIERAILEGQYAFACYLLLIMVGFDPRNYFPEMIYNRLVKKYRVIQTVGFTTAQKGSQNG